MCMSDGINTGTYKYIVLIVMHFIVLIQAMISKRQIAEMQYKLPPLLFWLKIPAFSCNERMFRINGTSEHVFRITTRHI